MADRKKRRSLRHVFKRPETPPATPSLPSGPSSPVERRTDVVAASPEESDNSSPRIRPRTLQKANRTSVFGSLRSLQSLDEDEKTNLTRTDSKASSLNEDGFLLPGKSVTGETVVLHGEVQMAGNSVFRKRLHYLVLTESHLVRFKSHGKAADLFPSLLPASSRPVMPRTSLSSAGSLTDLPLSSHNEITQGTSLDQIVAVYKLDDGRPYFSIEISYLDERTSRASSMQLQFNELRDSEAWLSAVQNSAAQARNMVENLFQPRTLDYAARILTSHRDYDPLHFRIFKVVQLSAAKSSSKSSTDDLSKLNTSMCYLAIGLNKVHLIPVPRISTRSSSTSLTDYDTPTSFGIATLSHVKFRSPHEAFRVCFTSPLGQIQNLSLASCQAEQIVLWLRFASEYLRPEWTIQPLVFDVPTEVDDRMDPPNLPPDQYNSFERTLVAYCAAYSVNIARLSYVVDHECEDAPCFRLLAPLTNSAYTSWELLAIMRALRYNEYFTSISFADIDLRPLRLLYDPSGSDMDCQSTRSGTAIALPGHSELSLLSQEIRALALKSRRLRRLDFTNAMSKLTATGEDQCCGIPVALTPLSKRSLTNVDWVILNGVGLGEADLNHLVDAASERRCHIRALEVGDCGLSIHDIDVLLSTLSVHENTMEVIDISGAQGRFSPELFQRGIGAFSHMRRLNLTRCQKTAGIEPLLAPEILLGWRLESLHLGQTALNEQAIDAISVYLASPKSRTLKELHINQCGLTGKDLATLLRSMTQQRGVARQMLVNASENRLSVGSSVLAAAIAENYGPASLSMRMMDFEKEHHFRELIDAFSINTTVQILDISRISLPHDASEEACESLKNMFARNQTLEELDISGERAHIDAARIGIGLNTALPGLQRNSVLKLLRIEYQGLGLQGASTLAGVLEHNRSLVEIHCEHNEINLQSFTVLVNVLRRNQTLLYMPDLSSDKIKSLDKIKNEFEQADRISDTRGHAAPKINTLKKGMSVLSRKQAPQQTQPSTNGPSSNQRHAQHHRKSSSMASSISFTDQDVAATLSALNDRWSIQQLRLQQYLSRNYKIAAGTPLSDLEEQELEAADDFDTSARSNTGRPSTADSLGRILARVKMDRTPTVEQPDLLGSFEAGVDERLGNIHLEGFGSTHGSQSQQQQQQQQQQHYNNTKGFMFEFPDEHADGD